MLRVLWYLQGSNQGHMDFQSIALPSELRYRLLRVSACGLWCSGCKYRTIFNLSKTKIKKNRFVPSRRKTVAYVACDRCREYQNQVCCI